MNDDDFMNRVRSDARSLRYEPTDEVTWTRLSARIAAGIDEQSGAFALLERWFKPLAASLVFTVIIGTVSTVVLTAQRASTQELASSAEASFIQENYYSDGQ